jgi:hypothetical protein
VLTLSAGTGPKFSDCGFAFIPGATPLPFSLTVCDPNEALLFTCSQPFCLPFATGSDATSIVQEAPAGSSRGQLFDVTENPPLTVGCLKVTATAELWLTISIFDGGPRWPITSLANVTNRGLASSVAETGLGVAGEIFGVGVAVILAAAAAACPLTPAAEVTATSAAPPTINPRSNLPFTSSAEYFYSFVHAHFTDVNSKRP